MPWVLSKVVKPQIATSELTRNSACALGGNKQG
jgi:hypothetical protein